MTVKQRISAAVLGDGVAADIEGFDFSNYDEHDIAEVRKIWLKYGVIRFRRPVSPTRTRSPSRVISASSSFIPSSFRKAAIRPSRRYWSSVTR